MNNRESFVAEARYQGFCAVTGKTGDDWHPHHVIYQQHLRRLDPRGLYDPRGALRLSVAAHERHHSGVRRVRVSELRTCNIEYAFEIMGAAAYDYFQRYYDDDGDDRISLALAELEDSRDHARA